MERYLTVSELAERLGLHTQTVYRKVQRGELLPIRIGRTIRFRPEDLEGLLSSPDEVASSLPSFLHSIFWDVDFATLKASDPIVIERILEIGDLPASKWLLQHRPHSAILEFLHSHAARRLSAKSRDFWLMILGKKHESIGTAKETTGPLGEASWY